VITLIRLRWAGYVAGMEKVRTAWEISKAKEIGKESSRKA
jgi:hypothetical protein